MGVEEKRLEQSKGGNWRLQILTHYLPTSMEGFYDFALKSRLCPPLNSFPFQVPLAWPGKSSWFQRCVCRAHPRSFCPSLDLLASSI